MIRYQLDSLLTALLEVQGFLKKGIRLNLANGICSNIALVTIYDSRIFTSWLHENVPEWEKFSGSTIFPVKSPISLYSAHDYYMRSVQRNVWEGKYGEDRKELLQWCIDRITKQLEEL